MCLNISNTFDCFPTVVGDGLVIHPLTHWFLLYHSKMPHQGLPWWSSGQNSMLAMQGLGIQSLVRELNPTCCPEWLKNKKIKAEAGFKEKK